MMDASLRPRARQARLVVQRVADETLVYDLDRYRAFCLNQTAALVWRHCDGSTTVAQLADLLREDLDPAKAERVVWWTLRRLARARLLRGEMGAFTRVPRCSRRELLRTLGIAGGVGVLLPAILTIAAPTAAQAASGTTRFACFAQVGANVGKCCTDSTPRGICKQYSSTFGPYGLCNGPPC